MTPSARFAAGSAVALGATAMLAMTAATAAAADPSASRGSPQARPTILLVHGAFADAGGWDDVIGILQHEGYPVLALANPLRGLASDSAYVRRIIDATEGPVVLVGHSYGGAVITNAATGAANVTALVYVAAFVPDEGEVLGQFADPVAYPGAALTPDALVSREFADGEYEVSIDPGRFREIFAADLSKSVATRMAARQRPVAAAVFGEPSKTPAWKTIPSWYQVSGEDKAISPVAERFFAERAGSHTVEIDASHVAFISHSRATSRLIESAAASAR
ncbi:alpha/beta fold hydrolase [Microbacterium ulmi]|nr:alpha/beta hydrolase [Microbacterium ulmi]NII69245.1 pimeloyl-ACP methyl ester carboxylesterase [Microbacterium ulmi]